MYSLRLIAVAMLFHEDRLLMMKRSPNRTLSPGQWAGIGGHLEPYEMAAPLAACLREVQEETGLTPEDIEGLELRYIVTRLSGTDLRQQFVFAGRAKTDKLSLTEEGELHWIPRDEVLDRDIPYVYRSLLEHYLQFGAAGGLWAGTATLSGQTEDTDGDHKPSMIWVPLHDPLLL